MKENCYGGPLAKANTSRYNERILIRLHQSTNYLHHHQDKFLFLETLALADVLSPVLLC